MASITELLLGAGAQAKNDWAEAEASTSLTFTGEGQIRRGIDIEIGLSALASADAGLSRYIDASVRGNAFAEATASLRLQLPLNLFDEFGITVAAQAVAQAAAGIEAGLGLRVGDFIDLLRQNDESAGLPLDLVLLLLDEATLGGKFEIHVAAAAMAYASVLITGKVVKDAGFSIFADAGLGLAAGVGFSGSLDIGIHDFRRFYGRAVDRCVNAVVDGVGTLLPDDLARLKPQLRALAPMATTALRMAYEIGDYLAEDQPGPDHKSALDLANHCVGVVLEEAQRFLFARFVEAGLGSLDRLVTQDVPNLAAGLWDRLMPQRQALADALYRTPEEPFQPTDENASYWADLVAKAIELVEQLPAPPGAGLTRGMAMVFAAAELLREAIKIRINVAQAYAFAIGAGRTTSPPPTYDGPLAADPGPRIREHINSVLGRDRADAIDYPDLAAYLVEDAIITTLREGIPEIDAYLAIFQDPKVAAGLSDVVRVLLQNREAFIRNGGDIDPQETLRILLGLLDAFITEKITGELVPAVNQQLIDGNLKLYFNEVLVGTLLYAKEVAFQTVLDWEKNPVDRAAFTEALAGVMTMLLGRSLVLVADGFMTALQANMAQACTHAAAQLDAAKNPFSVIGLRPSPELKALIADTLRVGGEVFGPLPDDTRRRLRSVLYDVMETLPPGEADRASFVDNLEDQFFLPNEASVRELSDELLAISRARFQLFVERVLEAGGQLVAGAIEDVIRQAVAAVLQWAKDLDAAIKTLFDAITDLDRQIQQLVSSVQQAFAQAVSKLHTLLQQFSNASFRDALRQAIATELFRRAKAVLAGIPLYRSLPGAARQFVRNVLQTAIADLIEGPVLNPIFDAMGAAADGLDGMLEDIQALNPNEALAPQLLDLVLDRIEDRIREAFGGMNPRIDVGFDVSLFGFSQHLSLGTIELPLTVLLTMIRDAVAALGFYQTALQAAAAALAAAFAKSLDLRTRQDARRSKQADHDRLGGIRTDFTSTPKTIAIINPVQSLVYDDDVDMRIRLGGVPESYLGLAKDEQQRVLVFLNGSLIPPQALILDEPFAEVDVEKLLQPLDVAALPGFDAASRSIVGNNARMSFDRPAASSTEAADVPNGAPIAGAVLSARMNGRGPVLSQPLVQQSVDAGPGGISLVTSAVRNVLPGRRMTPSKSADLEQTLPPGTSIEFRAERAHLLAGANTLIVVVIDPGGLRYQQIVSFGVTAAAAQAGGARLPVAPERKPNGAPGSTRSGLDLQFDKAAIAQRVKQSQAFIARHSALQQQALRGR